MVSGGIDQDRIARALGVAPKTLRRHCRDVLDSGADRATSKVVAAMLHMATKAPYAVRFQAARFWLQCRAGWKETAVLEVLKLPSQMSEEELADLVARTQADIAERDQLAAQAGGTVVPFTRLQ
jgi:hypothetical protein